MEKYEYKSFNVQLSERELNKLGSDGWKLVNHTGVANQYDFKQYYVFMRTINQVVNKESCAT